MTVAFTDVSLKDIPEFLRIGCPLDFTEGQLSVVHKVCEGLRSQFVEPGDIRGSEINVFFEPSEWLNQGRISLVHDRYKIGESVEFAHALIP